MGEELKKVKSKPPKTSDFDILHLSEHLDCYIVHNLRCYTRLLLLVEDLFFSHSGFFAALSVRVTTLTTLNTDYIISQNVVFH